MELKRLIQSAQRRTRTVMKDINSIFIGLFRRSAKKRFITSHEKMFGRRPVKKRVRRILNKWKNTQNNTYSSSQKSKLIKRTILLFCTLILCFILLYNFTGAIKKQILNFDLFRLTNIQVTGCLKTTPEKIKEYIQVRYNSSLIAIDPKNLKKRLETHAWIFRAKVTRRLPGTLLIALQEYMPKAIIQLGEKEKLFYVDQTGNPFTVLKAGQDMDFPVITGLQGLNSTEVLKHKLSNIMKFLKLTDEDDPNLPVQSVSQIHVDPKEGTILFLVDFPFPIFLGKDNIQKKYNRLKKVVGFLYKERKRGMDINKIAYVRMDYSDKKVLVAHTAQADQR